MKLIAVFETYERYGAGTTKKLTANGKDKIDCLKKLVDRMGIYLDSEGIDEKIEEEGATFESLIKEIDESNGDGCDYIISLMDSEGNTYIDNDYEEEEID